MNLLKSLHTIAWCCCCAGMVGQSLALTLDDGPNLDSTPRLSGDDRNHRLLDAFREKGVRVVLFANGIRRGDSPEGIYWLEAWGKAGHRVGNHTYSHRSLEESGPAQFEEDLLRLDRLIRPLPGFWPMFRFPFLLEGKDAEERRIVQTMLKKRGYGGAPVSIPTYDWVFNARLQLLLKERPDADFAPLRALYFQHLASMLTGYRELARRLLGRDPIHTLLLHHNLLNAMVMPDLLRMLEANGWKVVDPEEAYLDPIYAEDLSSVGYHESHLGGLAQKRGLFLADVRRLEAQSTLEKANLKGYIH